LRSRSGEADAGEVQAALPPEGTPGPGRPGQTLPYRRYRSSEGTEIRVVRGARWNDELTFHHAAPDDVWLHARHAAGAHVVLRWKGEGNPSAKDLTEAAVLAALHSKARTSGSVPVDWTRRKYVRKPRKSPPGTVSLERARTVFVEPDPALEERLRVD
jgi:predicted ribosome quality control (RQC) complex YloA/Tae2 family protein